MHFGERSKLETVPSAMHINSTNSGTKLESQLTVNFSPAFIEESGIKLSTLSASSGFEQVPLIHSTVWSKLDTSPSVVQVNSICWGTKSGLHLTVNFSPALIIESGVTLSTLSARSGLGQVPETHSAAEDSVPSSWQSNSALFGTKFWVQVTVNFCPTSISAKSGAILARLRTLWGLLHFSDEQGKFKRIMNGNYALKIISSFL